MAANDKDKEKKKRQKTWKLVAGIAGSLSTVLPIIIVIFLPLLTFGFLSAVISGFTDWTSMWGSGYSLNDFTHYVNSFAATSGEYNGDVSDASYSVLTEGTATSAPVYTEDPGGNYKLLHYPTETDFVDIAIKAEIKQLSRNVYNNLTFVEAIEPFDDVYVTLLGQMMADFKSTYMDEGGMIVTNSAYTSLFDASGNFDETTVRTNLQGLSNYSSGLAGSMWTEGQIHDEYLGVNSADTGNALNIRNNFKGKSSAYNADSEGHTQTNDVNVANYRLADYLSQWMYATMKIDANRFITDAEQAEKYGELPSEIPATETPVYRETCSDKATSPLFYYTRKKTDGDTSRSVESEQKGGDDSERLTAVKLTALEMARYLARGNLTGLQNQDAFLEKIGTDNDGNYLIYDGADTGQGPFLQYEVLDPERVTPIEYDPELMANIQNIVGLGTVSTIYGQLRNGYSWYSTSYGSTLADTSGGDTTAVKQKADINMSGFYVYKVDTSPDGHTVKYKIAHAGSNYNSSDSMDAVKHYGYDDYSTWTFSVTDGSVSDTAKRNILANVKTSMDDEFEAKYDELMDTGSAAGQLLYEENERRSRALDAITDKYEGPDGIITNLEAERDAAVAAVDTRIEEALADYESKLATYNTVRNNYDEMVDAQEELGKQVNEGYKDYKKYLDCLLTYGPNGTLNALGQEDAHNPNYELKGQLAWYSIIECEFLAKGDGPGAQTEFYASDGYAASYLKPRWRNLLKAHIRDEALGVKDEIISPEIVINAYITKYYNPNNTLSNLNIQVSGAAQTVRTLAAEVRSAKSNYESLVESREADKKAAAAPYDTYSTTDMRSIPRQKELEQQEKDAVTDEVFTITFSTRVAWYLGDETTLNIPVFGSDAQSELLALINNYKRTAYVSSTYPNIKKKIVLKYGTVDAGNRDPETGESIPVTITTKSGRKDVNTNTCHFVIAYIHDGMKTYASMNHLICYRILYSNNSGNASVMRAPATINNRYNFSTIRTADGSDLVYKAEAKPVTNEGTLMATLEHMADIDEANGVTDEYQPTFGTEATWASADDLYTVAPSSGHDGDSGVGNTKITETETLKEMLTESTWTKRDRNWRKSFVIRRPDEEDTYYNTVTGTEEPYWNE